MSSGFKLKAGSKSLDKMFKNLEALCSEENFAKMIQMAAFIALAEARRLCPVDSGVMRDSITVTYDSHSFTLSCSSPYWHFNEYGWKGIAGHIGTEGAPVFYKGGYRPFLRPAMRAAVEMMDEFVRDVKKAKVAFNIAAGHTTWEPWMLE